MPIKKQPPDDVVPTASDLPDVSLTPEGQTEAMSPQFPPEPVPGQGDAIPAEPTIAAPAPTKHGRHWWQTKWFLIAAPATLILLVSLCFIAYGTTFGLSKTYLGTINVSPNTNSARLTTDLATAQKKYSFTIAYPDKHTASYTMADAGITIDPQNTVADFRAKTKHSGFRKFIWWRPMYFTVTTKTNTTKLDAFIKSHASSANVAAVNAQINVSNGVATIAPAKDGSAYTIPGGRAYLLQNIVRLKPAKLTLSPEHLPAAIQAKNLTAAKQKIDTYTVKNVSFTISDQTVQASKADIAGWLDISPVPSAHTADVTINSGKVLAYINKLSAKYTKPAVSEIQTTDDAGNTSVLISGSDGIDVTNQNDAAKAAASGLQNSDKSVIALSINHVAHTTVKAGDYDKWIVADLTTKRMYAYEHTTLVRSFLVSAGAPKTPTVVGQYKIYSKYVSKDMRGKNADGSRYFQPHVHYVNFFYKDYAIHGNYWRPSSYFGNINSSHGCIGITDSDAKWLYDWAPIGTTVITHA